VYRVAAQAGTNLSDFARASSQPTLNENEKENEKENERATELASASSVDFSEYAVELLTLP
jgi:hypothetical protein